METIVIQQSILDQINSIDGTDYEVVVWNNNTNTFEEVAGVLIMAIKCSPPRALELTMQIDRYGSATVFTGAKPTCETIAKIISIIGIKVTIEESSNERS